LIVQCEHCQTKYRIADEKVKGKGVKVRCAKCENVFTVTPENDLLAQSAAPASPPVPEPPAPEPQAPAPEPPAAPPLEGFASGDADGGTGERAPEPGDLPPLDSLQSPLAPNQDRQSTETGPLAQEDTGFMPPSPEDESLDIGAQRPAHELDQAELGGSTQDAVEEPEDGGFEIEATLREDSTPGSDLFGEETGEGLPEMPQEPEPGAEWGNIAIGGQAAPDPAAEGFGLAEGADFTTPPPAPPMEEPKDEPQPEYSSNSTAETTTVPSYESKTRSSGGGKKWLVLLFLFAALGAGGYFAYPKVMEMIKARGGQAEGILTPANIQVKALNRNDGKILYSVRGDVRNESEGSVGMVKVEAQFRDAAGEILSRSTAYCGNLFDDSKLVSLNLDKIQADLQNELGQSLSNANILPGKSVPFLVVLGNPPSGVSKVTVTITGFKETT